MQNEILKQLQDFSNQAMNSVKEMTAANQKVSADLLKQTSDLANTILEASAKNTQTLTEVKDMKDLNSAAAKIAEANQKTAKDLASYNKSCAASVATASQTYNGILENTVKAATAAAEKASSQCANAASGKSTKAA